MGFVEAVKTVFSKYAVFSGRAARKEFWFFVLFMFFGNFAAHVLDLVLKTFTPPINGDKVLSFGIFAGAFRIATVLPYTAVYIRRLHDVGRSGWWLGGLCAAFLLGSFLLPFTHVAGLVFDIVGLLLLLMNLFWLTKAGVPNPNRCGLLPSSAIDISVPIGPE